jgi:hypothetical protein
MGGDRFNGTCMTPQIHVFVTEAGLVELPSVGPTAERIVGRDYARIERAESDSGAWHTVRLAWTDSKTDWVKPASLDIWFRRYGSRILVLAVIDAWSDRTHTNAFLSSLR